MEKVYDGQRKARLGTVNNPAEAKGFYEAGEFVAAEEKVGRNEPCPCGSGKKYKKCCGK